MTAAAAPSRFRRPRREDGGDDSGVSARRWFTPWLLIAPGGLWLLIFFVFPLFSLGRLSLQDGGLSNYSTVISDNSTVIIRTFVYATISTLAAIIIGYPLAYVIATKGGKYKNLFLALVILPFFVTYLVRTLSWKILLFDNGPVVGILQSVGILNDSQGILGSPFAVVAALTYNFLPFMVLPIYVSLEKLDHRLLDAALQRQLDFDRATEPHGAQGRVCRTGDAGQYGDESHQARETRDGRRRGGAGVHRAGRLHQGGHPHGRVSRAGEGVSPGCDDRFRRRTRTSPNVPKATRPIAAGSGTRIAE